MRQKHTNVTENGTVANDTTTCPLNHIYCPHIGGCVEGISPDACHRDETLRYARGKRRNTNCLTVLSGSYQNLCGGVFQTRQMIEELLLDDDNPSKVDV